MENAAHTLKRRIVQSLIMLSSVLAIIATIFSFEAFAQEKEHDSQLQSTTAAADPVSDSKAMWGFLAAAIAFGLGAIGAGIAISNVGAAAMGAVAEKPEIAGQALIFVALAEGLVVFGFIMGLLILGKV
ncbi:MAG: hypothetical protein JW913_16490 [Chitinispirillaceae bacterium]|nr:hypothetical protein [Chitinispirillaceae bacterium]